MRCSTIAERLAKWLLVGDECWIWTGALSDEGYGQITVSLGRIAQVHRVVYELLVGPIASGLEPDHTCGNKACARPSHLEPVTHAENIQRALDRRGCLRGHPWTAENTSRYPDGRRECWTCKRARRTTPSRQAVA